jgi:nitroreductase
MDIDALIRQRRAVFPKTYTGEPVDRAVIEQLLENANWAPTHKFTEPWRFVVFHGAGRERLADYLEARYDAYYTGEAHNATKRNQFRGKVMRSGALLGILLRRDPEERVPEWEELAAVSMAVQNIWLSCAARGLGCYWSSPGFIVDAPDFPELQAGERCLGLFYIGPHELPDLPGRREPVADKVRWVTE